MDGKPLKQYEYHEGGRREQRRLPRGQEVVSAAKARRIHEMIHIPGDGVKVFMRYRNTMWLDQNGSLRRVFPKTKKLEKVHADNSALYFQTEVEDDYA